MKTWTLKVSEEELKSLIRHHADKIVDGAVGGLTVETSSRIHDLTKRLTKVDASDNENGEATPEVKQPDPWAST